MKTLIPPADLDVVGLGPVKAGIPVDVPDEMAGVAPDPRREEEMQKLAAAVAAHDHAAAQACRDVITGTDEDHPPLEMGYGLLAQGWTIAPPVADEQPAPAAVTAAPKTKAEKAAAAEAAAAAATTTETETEQKES